jgi:hypothetical protein
MFDSATHLIGVSPFPADLRRQFQETLFNASCREQASHLDDHSDHDGQRRHGDT